MADITTGLRKFIKVIGKGINTAKKAADKVLWGSVNEAPAVPAPGTPAPTVPKKSKVGSFIQSGLFNVLDALNSVDLCNVLDYLITSADARKKKRSETPTAIEKALYDLQDKAALIRDAIDKFYAFPSDILSNLKNSDPQAAPAPGTEPPSQPPPDNALVGSAMQKYNLGIVSRYSSNLFKSANNLQAEAQGAIAGVNAMTQQTLVDPDVQAALSLIPGFNTNINALQDYIGLADRYADFRAIPNDEFQSILKKLDTTRAVCVTIENMSLGSALDLAQQFSGLDIRSQIAKLNQFMNPAKIVPTLKEVDSSLRSFIATCKSIQSYIRIGRGIIKIALFLVKIYKYIAKLISQTPIPLMYATYNVVSALENAKEAAKENSTKLELFLLDLNDLMGVIIGVVTYLQQNAVALLQRVDLLISKLEQCTALDGSEVLTQLQSTRQLLIATEQELANILTEYNTKANPDSVEYGSYTIRVVEEDVVDNAIGNRRRRGIALDANGIVAAQSDLTFATNRAVIIEETKIKLVSLGLISPELSPTDLFIIEAMTYLGNDNVNMDDLNIPQSNTSTGLNNYLNSLPGGRVMRQRAKTVLNANSAAAKKAIASQMTNTSQYTGIINRVR